MQPRGQRQIISKAIIAGMSKLWLERNARVFERKSTTMAEVVKRDGDELHLWESRTRSGSSRGVDYLFFGGLRAARVVCKLEHLFFSICED
jgi:hypothetical protein